MAIFAFNHHNSPAPRLLNFSLEVFNRAIFLLNINPGHAYFVKVLYFIVGVFSHVTESIGRASKCKLIMRQKHKSNVAGFHSAKGGAVPTLTHHNS